MNDKKTAVYFGSILGGSLIIAVLIFSLVWSSSKNADKTITVTGSAKKAIVSDLAIQGGIIQAAANERKQAFQKIQEQLPIIKKFLLDKGFNKDQFEFFAINGYPVFEISANGNPTQNVSYYTYSQRFEITSKDVEKIKELSVSLGSLVEKGLDISIDMPQYIFTKIDELKIEVQAEAAKNAMERAGKIAESTGSNLGPLRTARMGVIQITRKNSSEISDYGMNDVTSIEKEVTAVVSASFEIR